MLKLFFYPTFCQKGPFFGWPVSVKLLTVLGQFQWNCPNLETRKSAPTLRYFKTERKKTPCLRWNSRTFGIAKRGGYLREFEAWKKLHFSSFKNENYRTFLVAEYFFFFWHYNFLTNFFHFFVLQFGPKMWFTRRKSHFDILTETFSSFRPVSKNWPETFWNCQSFTETGHKKKGLFGIKSGKRTVSTF